MFHPWILQDRDSFVLPVYLGPGLRVIDYSGGSNGNSHFAVGLRGVIGLLFDFKNVPLDAFLEVAGVARVRLQDRQRRSASAFNAGAGIRYYF